MGDPNETSGVRGAISGLLKKSFCRLSERGETSGISDHGVRPSLDGRDQERAKCPMFLLIPNLPHQGEVLIG